MKEPMVITMAREYASGGSEIAQAVADKLGIPLYNKELITLAAKKSGLTEEAIAASENQRSGSLIYSLYMMGNTMPLADQVYILQSNVIKELAAEGPCVILGRCGDYVLRERPNVLRTFIIYPEILWRYNALRDNEQAEPISVVANVEVDGKDLGQKVRTFSVRSINECLLGFNKQLPDGRTRYVSTRLFYAAYVNEENPLIDKVLREALNTRIVRRFLGYQSTPEMVDKQVYALWYVLQKRNFKYSSVSYSSLSSNVVYAQRVRTFEDALNSSQINCVDGSVLFASLLRAINITPVLVQMPGHMFVGYYTDSAKKNLTFLETTMIGDVDLDDYFPDEKLDSTRTTKSQGEMSRLTFEKSKEYALREYMRVKDKVQANKPNYLFVEINKNVRRNVQSIGK